RWNTYIQLFVGTGGFRYDVLYDSDGSIYTRSAHYIPYGYGAFSWRTGSGVPAALTGEYDPRFVYDSLEWRIWRKKLGYESCVIRGLYNGSDRKTIRRKYSCASWDSF